MRWTRKRGGVAASRSNPRAGYTPCCSPHRPATPRPITRSHCASCFGFGGAGHGSGWLLEPNEGGCSQAIAGSVHVPPSHPECVALLRSALLTLSSLHCCIASEQKSADLKEATKVDPHCTFQPQITSRRSVHLQCCNRRHACVVLTGQCLLCVAPRNRKTLAPLLNVWRQMWKQGLKSNER